MTGSPTLLAAAVLAGFTVLAVLVLVFFRRASGMAAGDGDKVTALALLQQQIDALRAEIARSLDSQAGLLDRRIADTSRAVGERLDASGLAIGERLDAVARTVGELRQTLGQVQEASERIFDVGRSIAALQNILRSPKIRGGLGELFLGELLGQILPEGTFSLQHPFRSGAIVDAVVRVGANLVAVDAKFPLENFQRVAQAADEAERRAHRKAFILDVKRHIDTIAEKYIRPDEGTFDFALMYIPAENVYYETIVRDEAAGEGQGNGLFEHAIAKRVVPVSPNSFYVYLQVILLGLRGMRIEDTARQIVSGLARTSNDLDRFQETFDLVGKHLNNAGQKHEAASRQLERLRGGFESLKSSSAGTEALPATEVLPAPAGAEGLPDPVSSRALPAASGAETLPEPISSQALSAADAAEVTLADLNRPSTSTRPPSTGANPPSTGASTPSGTVPTSLPIAGATAHHLPKAPLES